MILELSFVAGRYHATPWGRHVNEAVPEWPPSPFRLLRAMLDVWYRKHPEIPSAVIEGLLSRLSVPPRFSLPRARASHTRSYLSQNKEDPSDKKLVFDGFAIVDSDSKTLVGWPDLALDAEATAALRTLAGSLNYLGRSESWVHARVLDDRVVGWNCEPLQEGVVPPQKSVVSVACVVTPGAYVNLTVQLPAKGKAKPRSLAWLEALTWGSGEAIDHTMNRPPLVAPTFYARDADALEARPVRQARASTRRVEAARFAVDSKVKVPITDALLVGEHVRRNLMGALRRVTGSPNHSSTFSGKSLDGLPVHGHTHASIFALDEDSDGFIDSVLVTSPHAFSVPEQRALDRLRPVPRRNGHDMVLTPVRFGTRAELCTECRIVVSHTPFAPVRHHRLKRDGDEAVWLLDQVALECEQRSLPRPVSVRRVAPAPTTLRRMRWLDFCRQRKKDSPQPAYGVRIEFDSPVLAPLSLGYASHFGLGCLMPESSGTR